MQSTTKFTTYGPDRHSHYVFRNTMKVDRYTLVPHSVTSMKEWQTESYNCGMIEHYTGESKTMAYHTDSAIDLSGNIAVISLTHCSPYIEIISKENDDCTKVFLQKDVAFTFSLDYNSRHRHRIIFPFKHQWEIVTLYQSHTLSSDLIYSEDFMAEFCAHRSLENRTIMTSFPSMRLTHSIADVSPPYIDVLANKHLCLFEKVFDDDMLPKMMADHTLGSLLLGVIVADRIGCYIGEVNDGRFPLLRCSTQFKEGTHNMKSSDRYIFHTVNSLIKTVHGDKYPKLNHALFQSYLNHSSIGTHSDKTRDMPESFIIAFVTFYDKQTTGDERAKLRFYKKGLEREALSDSTKPSSKVRLEMQDEDFEIVLNHGSVILTTDYINDNYTHTIIETSGRSTRSSYTMRTSAVEGCWTEEGVTVDGITMRLPSKEEKKLLKQAYADENTSINRISYPECLKGVTVNIGDMMPPIN